MTLLIRPGVNFEEGERYIVALRNLKDESGEIARRAEGFRLYRDRVLTTNEDVEARRAHFESLFATLAAAGIGRDTSTGPGTSRSPASATCPSAC